MINIATVLKHNVIGKLLNHVAIFFINIFIVRHLGASESGLYFNELYLLNFIVFVFSAGLDYAAIALLSQEPFLLPTINRMLFKVVVFFAAILSVYVFFLLPMNNHYFRQPAVAIILFSIGNLLMIFYQGILSALKKFNLQNMVLGISNILFLIYLFVFFTPKEKEPLETIAIAYSILYITQGIMMFILSYTKNNEISIPVRWNVFIRSGIYIMVSSLIYFAFLRVDNFFVEKYENVTTLGNYVQCGKIGQYFLYFSSVISSTLLPFISTETVGASYSEWKKMMKPYIILLCLAAVAIAASGKFIFPFLFGEDFTEMYPLMLILLPGFVCLGMLTLLNAVYIGKGNIRKIFIGDLTGLLMVTGFDIWLVPLYGAYAAAIISSVAYCLVFIYLAISFKKQFLLPIKKSGLIQF